MFNNRESKSAGESEAYAISPYLSIVTVVFNDVNHIEETILSVIGQSCENTEYIVIDGGSTDGTLDVINKYRDCIDYLISESDVGIYDAMNKGISVATGNWINFMNAGDIFIPDIFPEICHSLDNRFPLCKFLVRVEHGDIHKERASPKYLSRHMLNHQGIFYRSDCIKYQQFDPDLKIIGDLKHLVEYNLWENASYIDLLIAEYKGGGVASTAKSRLINYRERMSVLSWKSVSIKVRSYIFLTAVIGYIYNILRK